jgi:fermentation-respiration switch protein FrsA (DUF1100 family)
MNHRPGQHRRIIRRLIIALIICGAGFPVFWRWLVPRLIYVPGPPLAEDEAAPDRWGVRDARAVRITTSDGVQLHAWWVSARTGWSQPCGIVIVLHGNAGNITSRRNIAAALADRGLDVLLFDYRGYGASTGSPTEDGLYRDAEAAYRYVLDQAGTAPERVVLISHSLGTAVATHLAAQAPLGGVVLVAPFTSLPGAARARAPLLPPFLLPRRENRFDSLTRIQQVRAPILMVAAGQDNLIPEQDAHALFDAASEPKQWLSIEGAGHNNVLSHTAFWRTLERSLGAWLGCGPQRN